MKETLEFILSNALPSDTPVDVRQTEDDSGITFFIEVPEEFRGKIIGRSGSNIRAIRDVLNIIARRNNQRIYLKIVE